jgi:hypothetical protein
MRYHGEMGSTKLYFVHEHGATLSADNEADARLIAAAPELYEALAGLLHELEWVNEQLDLMPDDYADALTFAQAALAKAAGQ